MQRFLISFLKAVTRGPVPGSRGVLVAAMLLLGTIGIGLLDYATGSGITFGAAYLIPVVAGGVLCSVPLAMLIAAFACATWSTVDVFIATRDYSWVRAPANSVLRFIILGLIVALLAALRDALNEARRSEQRSQDFLAFAAHQLRTPTAAASTAAQTLLARGGSEDDEELLVRIAHETRRAGRLVGAVLQFLRMDHSRELPRSSVDLDAVCREAIDRSRDAASMVSLKAFVGGSQAPMVQANPDALIEALCCLLDNARRHARSTIEIRTAVVGPNAELVVADDGPGLPADLGEQAFAPFVSSDKHGGTGLGLAIARGLVEGQHGTLTYENREFVIRVPVNPAA